MKVVDFLLRNGAQIGEMDQNGKTALHWAVEYGHYEIMLRLLVVWVIDILHNDTIQNEQYMYWCLCNQAEIQ